LILAEYGGISGVCARIQAKIKMAGTVNGLTLLCLTVNNFFLQKMIHRLSESPSGGERKLL
ncbi:hypothetical protein, partial [Xenorhabdus littoralis]|uniref:hypothetical protein n=1 Tax=Xenorhabdus littoralis TaxID=2582835 RepID=UPI0029E81052